MLEIQSTRLNLPWMIIIISSLIAGIYLYCDLDRPDYYFFLPLLPLIFALINAAVVKVYEDLYKNIGVILVISLYYCRLVVVPVIMSIGNYSSVEKSNITSNMPGAIALMIYELVVVYIALYLAVKRCDYSIKGDISGNEGYSKQGNTRIFGAAMASILLFDIAVFIFIPESRYFYNNIFDAINQTSYDVVYIDDIVARGNIIRACLTLYTMTMGFVRVIAPAYFIIALRRRLGEKAKGVMLSIPFILLQFILVSNTQADSVLCALVLMFLLSKLYPSWSAKIYRYSLISGSLFVVWYFAYKFMLPSAFYSSTSMGEYASELANAYFSGPDNIAASFNVTIEDKWTPLFYTFVNSIPFNGTLFGITGSNFSLLYNNYNGSQFQIAPCIGESNFYLGAVFSPIVPVIFTSLAVRYGFKAQMEKNLWKYAAYVYFTLHLSMSLIMYNGTIFLKTFTETILPMIILSNLSEGQKLNSELNMRGMESKSFHECYGIDKSMDMIEG